MEVSGFASADAREPDIASFGGVFCDAHGGAYLASRWRILGTDKTPGFRAGAGAHRARPSSYLLPPPSLFGLEGPSFAGLLLPLFFLFGCALPPVAAFCDVSIAGGRLELPRRKSKHGPRTSSRTVRARRRKGMCRWMHNGGTKVCGGTRR